MSRASEDLNRRMLRARDVMDREYADPLDIPTLAAVAHVSPAHFIRCFRTVFGETPHRYLQRRRVERAMFLLRTGDLPVTEICFEVGFGSLGTFSRTFSAIVGESPTAYRRRGPLPPVPSCFTMRWARPSGGGNQPGKRGNQPGKKGNLPGAAGEPAWEEARQTADRLAPSQPGTGGAR